MDKKIFIIHSSEIVQSGLSIIIKKLFGIDSVLLGSADDIKNYTSIAKSKIILLLDAIIDQEKISTALEAFSDIDSVTMITIRDRADNEKCNVKCSCCLSIMDATEHIQGLLDPLVQVSDHSSERKASPQLTERELDVVKLIAIGKTNKEIADELYISVHTVISHRKNITEKLGIKSISGITVYAILNNLIDASNLDLE